MNTLNNYIKLSKKYKIHHTAKKAFNLAMNRQKNKESLSFVLQFKKNNDLPKNLFKNDKDLPKPQNVCLIPVGDLSVSQFINMPKIGCLIRQHLNLMN
jgi:hypothetical protein